MSTSEVLLTDNDTPVTRTRPTATGRFLRSELRLVFGRRRNQAILVVLALAPILLGIAIKLGTGSSRGGPAFIGQVAGNGLFLAFTSLVVALPLFLPLAVSVVAGEAVAGEASAGTLRNLLVVPVGRTRLLVVKYAGIVAYSIVAAFVVAMVGVIVGLILFPTGPVTLLSGDSITYLDALGRVVLVAGYVSAMLAGIAAIGLFISTLTEVPIAAMATTAILVVIVAILQAVPQIAGIHPFLFTDSWLAFGDILRDPVVYDEMGRGLLVQAIYVAVFGTLAWARFSTRDISS